MKTLNQIIRRSLTERIQVNEEEYDLYRDWKNGGLPEYDGMSWEQVKKAYYNQSSNNTSQRQTSIVKKKVDEPVETTFVQVDITNSESILHDDLLKKSNVIALERALHNVADKVVREKFKVQRSRNIEDDWGLGYYVCKVEGVHTQEEVIKSLGSLEQKVIDEYMSDKYTAENYKVNVEDIKVKVNVDDRWSVFFK